MKKLVVLIMVLALMAIALPVMASEVSLSGELTAGFNTDFSTYSATAGNASVSLAAKVDKNNTVNTQISAAALGTGAASFNNFYLVSDLGGIFGLSGVDPVLTVGYGDPATASTYSVSGYGNESVVSGDSGATTEIALATAIGTTANVFVAFDPNNITNSATADHLAVSGNSTFGPITAAVYYAENGVALGKGSVGAAAKYSGTMSGISVGGAGSVAYDLTAKDVLYGVGLSAGMKMGSAGLGFNGDTSTAKTMHLTANASLTPSTMYGVDLGTAFNLTSGAASAFDTLDASGWVMAGATKIRLGYLYEPTTGGVIGGLNSPANVPGMYASFDLSF